MIKDKKHCQHLFSLHLGIKEKYVWKYAKHVRSSKGLKVTYKNIIMSQEL